MADRIPLILDDVNGRLQELPLGDSLDLTGNNIVNVGVISANSISLSFANINNATLSEVTIDGNVSISNGDLVSNTLYSDYIENSGILRTGSVSISGVQVISPGRGLQNITSIDTSTRSTLESALSLAPNDFTSLNITGISTFAGLINANGGITISGISSLGILNATSSYIGIATVGVLSATSSYINELYVGIITSTSSYTDTLNIGFSTAINSYIGVATVGFLSATSSYIDKLDVGFSTANSSYIGISTVGFLSATSSYIDTLSASVLSSKNVTSNNLFVSGISTLGSSNGIGTVTIGIGTTALYVQGTARITGPLTIGSSTIVISPDDNTIKVGSGMTLNGDTNTLTVANLVVTNNTTGIIAAGVGITVKDDGSILGSASEIDFGKNLSIVLSSGIATITVPDSINYWNETPLGIHTLSNVGIGTTNPTEKLEVIGNASISGIITATSFTGSGANLTTLNASNISSGTLYNARLPSNISVSGIITSTQFSTGASGTGININTNTISGPSELIIDPAAVGDNTGSVRIRGDLYVTGFTSFSGLNVVGITTVESLSIGSTQVISSAGQLQNITSLDSTTTATIESAITNSPNNFADINVLGVSTLGNVKVSSGIITAASGIVTYYGDGQYLNLGSNPFTGIGIGTTGGVVGYGITFIDFYGTGVSTAFYDSSVGIATIFFEGGGSGTIGIGTQFPTLSGNGDLFYNIDYGRLFVYYDEIILGVGTDAYWVDAAPFNQGTITTLDGLIVNDLTVNNGVVVTGIVTATDFNSTSDINLKTNIKTIENSLDKVSQLRGVSFDWKETGQSSYGVIAQELEEVLPELVKNGEIKTVNYNGIIGVLIESIKELKKEIEELKTNK